MDLLGVFDVGVMAVYLAMGVVPLVVIGAIIAYHKLTYSLTIFEGDKITRSVRIWSLKQGIAKVGEMSWDLSGVSPVMHKGRFGFEPHFYVTPDNAMPLQVKRGKHGGFDHVVMSAEAYTKVIKQEVTKALMTPKDDMRGQLVYIALGLLGGIGIGIAISASGLLPTMSVAAPVIP